tara:strand:+ start:1902 stop:2237 length:336 start_codon:yes stop_codon:yes gene_type:complete
MDIKNLDWFAGAKKKHGKRVAIYDGTEYGLKGTVAVVDFMRGYIPLTDSSKASMRGYISLNDSKNNDYANWDQVKIDAWNKKQGLTDEEVEALIDQSFIPEKKERLRSVIR